MCNCEKVERLKQQLQQLRALSEDPQKPVLDLSRFVQLPSFPTELTISRDLKNTVLLAALILAGGAAAVAVLSR